MSTSHIHEETVVQLDNVFYNESVNTGINLFTNQLERVIKSYFFLNLFFLFLFVSEITSLFFFFTFFYQAFILAFALAFIFLTFFSYFILRLYFQAKKPEQFFDLCDRYIKYYRETLNFQEDIPDHHLALANACSKFATSLHGKEYSIYLPPLLLNLFSGLLKKLSHWWHWEDLYKMRELLLNASVEEYIKLVKCEPTSFEAHAALANAYVLLSNLYRESYKQNSDDEGSWDSSIELNRELHTKFRATSERAVEEFKILSDYAPDDPWVHAQLAYSYHDLEIPEEELKEYEILLKLRPEDKDVLFKLGMLYFQQGLNAKGLQIYEELKSANYKKAENLIKFYGSYYRSL
jgi:hypothetical protein